MSQGPAVEYQNIQMVLRQFPTQAFLYHYTLQLVY